MVEVGRDVARADSRRQFLGLVEVPGRQSSPVGTAQPVADLVVQHASHAAQLAQGVEVADRGHPRIGRRAVLLIEHLGGGHDGRVHPGGDRLEPLSHPAHPEVQAPWGLVERTFDGEERVTGI